MPTLSAYNHYFQLFKNTLEFTPFQHQHGDKATIDSFKQLMLQSDKTGQMFQLLLQYMPLVDEPEEKIAKLGKQGQSIVAQLQTLFSSKLEELQKQNLKRALEAGINIAFGTDAGNPGTLHGVSIFGEAALWQKAGISNQHILKAMTYGNAIAFSVDGKLGTIQTGKQADFVVVEQNPYATLYTLQKPHLVVKHGAIIGL
ncbi:amidohydrolase family protein [Pseudoalteromonas sp. S16_S37]|uniref:amidohydrolase family protein n=1 Tax=Pseudoalteromonas sp. S16_S37 TaxID=2720228 RepID=UPI0016804A8F|nr:amidohydrolase family protein [Pseudoalteromonas sp. S16_S37]MBD1583171.1 amidohydrolase family protein [Pseudoalteromonas sp. S16_S37]